MRTRKSEEIFANKKPGFTLFRGCRFLLEAAKATTRSPKAASSSVSKNKAAATTSKSSTSAGKQGRSPSARPTGILKVTPVSPTLHSFLGVSETSRGDAVKKIWDYIKLHNLQSCSTHSTQTRSIISRKFSIFLCLQDPMNKREINCDHKLKTLFGGKDKVGFLEISRLLSAHFVKPN
ncbi:PREDICTED: upstream activation factor subunit spp27-like [Nicotiana attenuata]|uniref:upstream activation factor subunit spp27-like n=1 Tax=Nicotiana attenuata TaxID=49451 RepID=UPI0009047BC8|nr:PREDICTED: upstream activation factor subunit spp27-like [Nicotiana attenuata]